MNLIDKQTESRRIITATENFFRVRFDYSPELVTVVKSIPGRQWSVIGRFWTIPINKKTILEIIKLKDFGFTLDDKAKGVLIDNDNDYKFSRIITTGKINDKEWFVVKFAYNEKILNFIHTINGRQWHQDGKYWLIPVNLFTVSKIKQLKDSFQFVACNLTKKRINSLNEPSVELEHPDKFEKLGGKLRPFQKIAVEFIIKIRKVIIGDQMGLGKTIEAIAAIHYEDAYPALIVCPSSVKLNWEKEINKWTPDKTICVINGRSNKGLPVSDYYIINYDILNHNKRLLKTINFKVGVVDESQFCKNPQTGRTRAVLEVFEKIELRILLTGTPIRNKPSELIPQLRLVNRLEDFGGWWRFAQRYCNAYEGPWGWDISGASNVEELNRILRSLCYIRRTKKEVLTELPNKTRSYVPVEINNRKEYESVKKDITVWYNEKSRTRSVLGQTLVKLEALKQVVAKGKLEVAINWISDFLSTEEKLVVFAHHRTIVDSIYEKFKKVATKLQGGMENKEKQKAIDSFQNDSETKLIVVSILAGGIGINLTAASNALFIEQAWSPADLSQAEDRLHRIGQRFSVNYYYLIGKNTVDEMIANLIEKKRLVVDGVTEGTTRQTTEIIRNFLKGGLKK